MKYWISFAIVAGIMVLMPLLSHKSLAEAPSAADNLGINRRDRLSNDPLTRSNASDEIIQPNPTMPLRTRSGDWATGYIHQPSGNLPTPHWLVIHETQLNCREQPGGRIRANIEPGAIVTAVYPSGTSEQELLGSPNVDAVVQTNGSTWLRITGTTPGITPLNDHYGNQLTQLGECYVRANTRYVAPINPASMERLRAELTSQKAQ
jgi:hypothetical protein